MKKTFQLDIQGKHRDRVLDSIKHELHKYVKRERRRVLPEGVDYWDFDCRFGLAPDTAEVVHLSAITGRMDAAAGAAAASFYVEVLAKPGRRKARPASPGETDTVGA